MTVASCVYIYIHCIIVYIYILYIHCTFIYWKLHFQCKDVGNVATTAPCCWRTECWPHPFADDPNFKHAFICFKHAGTFWIWFKDIQMERRCVNLCHERNQETIRNRRRRNSWKFVQLCERDFEREQENMTLMKETFDWECACVILLYYVCVCLCTFVYVCVVRSAAKCKMRNVPRRATPGWAALHRSIAGAAETSSWSGGHGLSVGRAPQGRGGRRRGREPKRHRREIGWNIWYTCFIFYNIRILLYLYILNQSWFALIRM